MIQKEIQKSSLFFTQLLLIFSGFLLGKQIYYWSYSIFLAYLVLIFFTFYTIKEDTNGSSRNNSRQKNVLNE